MRLILPMLSCLVFVALSFAADWPVGGRSANRNPVSPESNPPTDLELPVDGSNARNVRWHAQVGSRAGGGPIVSGGLVWVGTNNELPDADRPDLAVLACFRESDGKPLYRYESSRGKYPADWQKQSMTGAPMAEGDRLWFVNNRREVVCLDTSLLRRGEGKPRVVWTFDMVRELKVHPRALMIPWPDALGSPAAFKDLLFVPTGNARMSPDVDPAVPAPEAPALVCLGKDTGKVVWSDNSPGRELLYGQNASPLAIEVAGRGLVIHPQGDGWVRAFDALSGKLVWKFDVNPKNVKGNRDLDGYGGRVYVISTPVYAEGRVYFATGREPEACGQERGRLFAIDPAGNGDVSPELEGGNGRGKPNPNSAVKWEYSSAGPEKDDSWRLSVTSVTVRDGLVFAADFWGGVRCLDAKTGKLHWSHDAKGAVYSNPLVVGDKLYIATQGGDLWIFDATASKRTVRRIDLGIPISANPAFANGVLYLLTEGSLFAISHEKPAQP